MHKHCLPILFVALLATSAWAIKPFSDEFMKKYAPEGSPLEKQLPTTTAKCNVCHMGKTKKMRNEFGVAVSKYLKKADFVGDEKKYDPKTEEGQKAIAEGLAQALKEKSSKGKTFAELVEAGELPAESKEEDDAK